MNHRLTIETDPAPEKRELIAAPLRKFNQAACQWDGPHGNFAIYLENESTGETEGGIWGDFGFDWMFVKLLAVSETARGQGLGKKLMEKAEAFARDKHLAGIRLETFSFQARGFYEKLGFTVIGQIDDFPKGHACFFLTKRLD